MIRQYSCITTEINYYTSNLIILFFLLICSCSIAPDPKTYFTNEQIEIIQNANRIINYEVSANSILESKPDWINSTFYTGIIAFHQATRDEDYLAYAFSWADKNNWKLGNRSFHADDQLAGFVYFSLYDIYRNPSMIEDSNAKFKEQLLDTSFVWWWSDALFMAPPAFTFAHSLDQVDLEEYVYREWIHTYDRLYSKEDSLFYRDKKFNNHISKNGDKQFWLRGNGWVVAGLALQLSKMESSDKYYDIYISVFQEMTTKLAHLYQAENIYSMDLLYPYKYPQIESSGTALICYALTKGINDGIIKSQNYNQIINDCYSSITQTITDSGKLIHVQPPNAKPEEFNPGNSEPFGSGAALLFLSAYFEYISP